MFATIAYGALERWPQRLPSWLERWFAQIVGVVIAGCIGAAFVYALPAGGDLYTVLRDEGHRYGMISLMFACAVVGPPIAFAAIMRRREMQAREQTMRYEIERAEFERQAADSRLALLQAQVQPHFLYDALANIRALVNAGSPRTVQVMDSLIAYLHRRGGAPAARSLCRERHRHGRGPGVRRHRRQRPGCCCSRRCSRACGPSWRSRAAP